MSKDYFHGQGKQINSMEWKTMLYNRRRRPHFIYIFEIINNLTALSRNRSSLYKHKWTCGNGNIKKVHEWHLQLIMSIILYTQSDN